MNKLLLLLTCLIAQTGIHAAQASPTEEKSQEEAQPKHIFEKFAHKKGFDESTESVNEFFVISKKGRGVQLENRIAEHFKEVAASQMFEILTNTACVSSSLHYNHELATCFYNPKEKFYPRISTNPLRTFVAGIAALEHCMIENTKLAASYKKLFEHTRICDLYILKAILENDNSRAITEAKPDSLPEILAATHAKWPPRDCAAEVIHPTSAFLVVQEALKHRKEHNIDALDDDAYLENWGFRILKKKVPAEAKEDEKTVAMETEISKKRKQCDD